jgi:type VI secretion system protein ImpE
MMQARALYREGKLTQAIQSLQAYLRDRPGDAEARIFLFELLCFAGEAVRAARQLNALGSCQGNYDSLIKLYGAALEADSERQEAGPVSPVAEDFTPVAGTIDGRPFTRLTDADEIAGATLEFIGGTRFQRIPFRYLSCITIAAPARLRDLYFLPAAIETTPELSGFVFEQVLLPCLYAGSFRNEDDAVKLGRMTTWSAGPNGALRPAGLRLLLADDQEIALTDIRSIRFRHGEPDASGNDR